MAVMNTVSVVEQLSKLGFKPYGDGYRHNGFRAHIDRRWLTFQSQASRNADPLREAAGVPGLWKTIRSSTGRYIKTFDLPLPAVIEQEVWDVGTGDPQCPLSEMIDWVTTTASGHLPAAWACPPSDELEGFLPRNALTLEIGRFARQGQLVCDSSRLSLSMTLLQQVPVDLSPQRRERLDELLTDAQHRIRMVRLVELETSESTRSIVAEVDLSGAPPFAVRQLLRIGLDAVRHVVSQTISVVELLVDPTVTSTVWGIPSVQERPAEGSQK